MTTLLFKIIRLSLFAVIFCNSAYAGSNNPVGIGEMANTMMEPVSLMADFIHTGCFIIGGSFIFASLIKYIEHRRSPLMVPISTVVFLFIAGIVLVALPFLSLVLENGVSYGLIK